MKDKEKKRLIEMSVSDAITEKPVELSIGGKEFKIYPPTLGKMQILSKIYLMLDIDEIKLGEEPQLEAMRICEEKTDTVCQLIAVATFKEKDDLLNDAKINERAEFFRWNASPEHFSIVMIAILSQIDYVNFINSIRLTKILRINTAKVSKRPDRVEQSEAVQSGEQP